MAVTLPQASVINIPIHQKLPLNTSQKGLFDKLLVLSSKIAMILFENLHQTSYFKHSISNLIAKG